MSLSIELLRLNALETLDDARLWSSPLIEILKKTTGNSVTVQSFIRRAFTAGHFHTSGHPIRRAFGEAAKRHTVVNSLPALLSLMLE
jgi:hypothetical protein